MKQPNSFSLHFHGTRGSTAPDGPACVYGGHTTCLEVIPAAGQPFFIDLGTGAPGGINRAVAAGVRNFDIFLTHLHSDHVAGLFGLRSLYHRNCTTRIFTCHHDAEAVLTSLLQPPLHPVAWQALPAAPVFSLLEERGMLELPERDMTLSWCPLPHPQGSTAFRFDTGTSAAVFATDVELARSEALAPLRQLAQEPFRAGLIILDGFFGDDEASAFQGWGHSSWTQARDFAAELGIRDIIITHHHPARDDAALTALAAKGKPLVWARDGDCFTITDNRLRGAVNQTAMNGE
jgi:phosphoribosyl 1,2-cyclic phosphodiesterase